MLSILVVDDDDQIRHFIAVSLDRRRHPMAHKESKD
jgi:CheY-like chemotaxis protein